MEAANGLLRQEEGRSRFEWFLSKQNPFASSIAQSRPTSLKLHSFDFRRAAFGPLF